MKAQGSKIVLRDWAGLVRGLVDRIRFGQVVITIHQGKVVQVEHTEKTRLDQAGASDEELSIRST